MKNLNEEISRIKKMMGINEDFEFPNPSTVNSVVDCDVNILDSNTIEITVMYNEEDKYETYLASIDYEFEDGEAQTYDYPGSLGGASGSVNGVKMIHPEERILTPKEYNELLSIDIVNKSVSSTIDDMSIDAYEGRNTGPDPDEEYERSRENDYE
jgi:hypothetical protein